ncbi:MAG TPA: hypothetical protein VMT68_08765 [Caulobacteraceae bacterium]|nr:hypothetical protein [Caulobacteraceae bacterium]
MTDQPEPQRTPPMWLRHPGRQAPVDRVEVTVGTQADGSLLIVDVTTPAGRSPDPIPVCLIVHGAVPLAMGAVMRRSQMYRDWGAALAGAGVAGLMFDHSLGWPELDADRAMAETGQVLAWLAANATARRFDLARLSAILVSGGGVLAPALLDSDSLPSIRRAALFSPLTGDPDGRREGLSLAAAAPAIARRGVRLAIFRAGGDDPGLLSLLDAGVAALLAADADILAHNLPDAPHCYEVRQDGPRIQAAVELALGLLAWRDGDG